MIPYIARHNFYVVFLMKNQFADSEIHNASPDLPLNCKDLSRKRFLALAGKSVAAGGLVFSGVVTAQTRPSTPKAMSPPARIPSDPEDPIELEVWKSDADPASAPTPTPMPPDSRVGYAVVGLGHLALEEVLPALSKCKKSKLVALVSGSPEKMKKVARQYGIADTSCYSYQNFDSIKTNKSVDVVYIILPNGLHKEYVIRAAAAGKHILCEKPMANTADECREMIAACKKSGVKLMVAYRIQYQPHNRYIREQIRQKKYGAVKMVEATNSQSSANKNHWRHNKKLAGGGSLPDIGLYCLNTTRFILAEEPSEVFAYQYSTPGNELFTEVEEIMSWQMRFPSGVIANCSTNYFVHESRRYRVMSERGWMDLENAYAYKGQQLKTSRADGQMKVQEIISIAETDQFGAEMDHFSDCVINNKVPFTPGEEGLRDQLIMEAIYKSAATGKPVLLAKAVAANELHGPEPDLS